MVKIINPFFQENPLANAVKSAGKTLFGDTLTPALKRQTLRDKEREEFGTEQLAHIFGAANTGAVDPNAVAEMGIVGGMDPKDAAMWGVYLAGNKTGPRGPLTTNAMAGAGKYEDSAENLDLNRSNAFNMNESDNSTSRYNNAADNTRALTLGREGNDLDWAKWFLKPEETNVDGEPGYATQGALAGNPVYRGQQLGTPPSGVPGAPQPAYSPILTKAEQSPVDEMMAYADAFRVANPTSTPEQQRSYALQQISKSKSKGVTVYGPDGNPIVEMGGDGAMDLTNGNLGKAQGTEIQFRKFTSGIKMARDLILANPNSVGAPGMLRGTAQDVAIAANGLAKVFGIGDIKAEMKAVASEAARHGVILDFKYDPSVSQIESIMNILTFQGARAIQGDSDRITEQDTRAIKGILGDPSSLFASTEKLVSKLDLVEQYVRNQRIVNAEIMGVKLPADVAPAAPGAGEEDWTIGPDGAPVRVK